MNSYFDNASLLREVVGHRLTGLSGPRGLLVTAAHPARLRRTARVMDSIAFGSREEANRRTKRVRTIGLLPADVRREYGFRWNPLRGVAVDGGARLLRRVGPVVPGWRRPGGSPA